MKKLFIIIMATIGILSGIGWVNALTYSPDYLPGGKNYLSSDNFSYANNFINTISPFAVRPHQEYTLSFPREFYDMGFITWTITYYENEDEVDILTFDSDDLYILSDGTDYGKCVFMTPANVNYLSLSISDNRDYLRDFGLAGIILEEGNQYTGYEAFIIGNLIDINGPVFYGSGVIIVNVDDPVMIEDITAGIVAYDAIEGDVSENIDIVTDPYSAHSGEIGEYQIKYSANDSMGNTTYFFITVKVVDITAPIITGIDEITLAYPNTISIEAIRSQLNASDNVDGVITTLITLDIDDYTAHQSSLGIYEVIFKVTDSSGNRAYKTVEIYVTDQTQPIFTGPTTFTIGYDSTLSIADIVASQTVQDNFDLDLSNAIIVKSDFFTPNRKIIGVYPVVLKVVDSSGNITEKTINVQVTDGIGPVVYLDTSIIMVYDTTILGLSDFTTILIKSGELDADQTYEVMIKFDTYTDQSTTAGVYHLALDFKNSAGEIELSKTFQIVVKNKGVDFFYDGPIEGDNEEQYEQIFILRYWQYFASGVVFLLGIVLNVVWFMMYRKK